MGGKSSEHDVSLVSAKTVIENIDKDLYNVIMVGITKDGQWKLVDRKKGTSLRKRRQG